MGGAFTFLLMARHQGMYKGGKQLLKRINETQHVQVRKENMMMRTLSQSDGSTYHARLCIVLRRFHKPSKLSEPPANRVSSCWPLQSKRRKVGLIR